MKRDFEYAVLGLGSIGSAAAYRLARRAGEEVVGFEQFEIGHHRGASQDHSRIIRRSYHSPLYVTLAGAAYEAWRALERDDGGELLTKTGGLDLWPPGAALPMADYTSSMSRAGVPFEVLDGGEIMRRWPQFRLEEDTVGIYQEDGGIVAAARCNAAHVRAARARGATLLDHHPVTSVRPNPGELEVVAGGVTFRCSKLIVAADAWTNDVLAWFDTRLPLTVTQEQVTYFATSAPDDFSVGRFPVWIWMDEPSFYGFPVYGEAGCKVGQDVGGKEVTAGTRSFEPDPEALERVARFLEAHVPGAVGPVIYTQTCLYTMPPDRDFVIDSVPGHPNVFVALGAAHGFKFAALFGRVLEELAVDGRCPLDLGPFAIDRPILTAPDPVASFLQ